MSREKYFKYRILGGGGVDKHFNCINKAINIVLHEQSYVNFLHDLVNYLQNPSKHIAADRSRPLHFVSNVFMTSLLLFFDSILSSSLSSALLSKLWKYLSLKNVFYFVFVLSILLRI